MIISIFADIIMLGAFITLLDKRWGGLLIGIGVLGIIMNIYLLVFWVVAISLIIFGLILGEIFFPH